MQDSNRYSYASNSLVELSFHPLDTILKYIVLGNFNFDTLEKYFGKLRQESRGTYFITVQKIIEKFQYIKQNYS